MSFFSKKQRQLSLNTTYFLRFRGNYSKNHVNVTLRDKYVMPATRGSAAMTLGGLTGAEVAHPCEPHRAGCRGHWAAIHLLRVRLEVAMPCPTWS